MRHNDRNTTQEIISMEEYLEKRQAIRAREKEQEEKRAKVQQRAESNSALEMAELLYV